MPRGDGTTTDLIVERARGVYVADAAEGEVAFVLYDRFGRRRARLEVPLADLDRGRRILETFADYYLDVADPVIRLASSEKSASSFPR